MYQEVERAKIIKNNKKLFHNLEYIMIKMVIHKTEFVYHLKHGNIEKIINLIMKMNINSIIWNMIIIL